MHGWQRISPPVPDEPPSLWVWGGPPEWVPRCRRDFLLFPKKKGPLTPLCFPQRSPPNFLLFVPQVVTPPSNDHPRNNNNIHYTITTTTITPQIVKPPGVFSSPSDRRECKAEKRGKHKNIFKIIKKNRCRSMSKGVNFPAEPENCPQK